jgi:hypothetical protein
MIASAGVRHKAEQAKLPASINLALGVSLGTEIATIVAAAGWVIRANAVTSTLPHLRRRSDRLHEQ